MRRRYIQDPDTGELHEVTADYQPTPRNTDHVLWNDRNYDGLRATDGADISSRSKHREYMRVNNLAMADDFQGKWNSDAKRRAEYFKEGRHGATRREDVARAIAQLESGRRR